MLNVPDLKPSLNVRVHIKYFPENFALSILKIIKLFTRKVFEMFVYKHTETLEYVKN